MAKESVSEAFITIIESYFLTEISIENRPLVVAKRERPDDIEFDLMMVKKHKVAILVMIDRVTLQTRLTKLKSKEIAEVRKGIMSTLKSIMCKVHTLTFDNNKDFACHLDIATKMNLKAFFARPQYESRYMHCRK